MDKYISQTSLIDKLKTAITLQTAIANGLGVENDPEIQAELKAYTDILDGIKKEPAADVRPVVTCAECDWHVDCGYHFCNKWCQPCPDNADFYCAYGECPTAGQI